MQLIHFAALIVLCVLAAQIYVLSRRTSPRMKPVSKPPLPAMQATMRAYRPPQDSISA